MSLVRAGLPVQTTTSSSPSGQRERVGLDAGAELAEAHEAAEHRGRDVRAAAVRGDRVVALERGCQDLLAHRGSATSWPCAANTTPAAAAAAAADEPRPSLRPSCCSSATSIESVPATAPSRRSAAARAAAASGGIGLSAVGGTELRVRAATDRGDDRFGAFEHGVLAGDHHLAGRARGVGSRAD